MLCSGLLSLKHLDSFYLVPPCSGYLCLQKLHQTKDDIKSLNGRLRLEDNVSVVASPTINGPHSLTTDLLPLLSALIFTAAKILFDDHQLNIAARAQG